MYIDIGGFMQPTKIPENIQDLKKFVLELDPKPDIGTSGGYVFRGSDGCRYELNSIIETAKKSPFQTAS